MYCPPTRRTRETVQPGTATTTSAAPAPISAGHSFANLTPSAPVQRQADPAIQRDDDPNGDGAATRDQVINTALQVGGFLPGPLGLAAGAIGGAEAIRQAPGANPDDLQTMKNTEGLAGFGTSVLGTAASLGGFDAAAAIGIGGEGLGAGAVTGAGLEGAAALGPGALVAGAGLFGLGTGHYLSEHTRVGGYSEDAVGGIDSGITSVYNAVTGGNSRSAMLDLDDARQENWNQGNYGRAVLDGVGEGVVGLGGAIGGLAHGGWDLLRGAASAMQSDNID